MITEHFCLWLNSSRLTLRLKIYSVKILDRSHVHQELYHLNELQTCLAPKYWAEILKLKNKFKIRMNSYFPFLSMILSNRFYHAPHLMFCPSVYFKWDRLAMRAKEPFTQIILVGCLSHETLYSIL